MTRAAHTARALPFQLDWVSGGQVPTHDHDELYSPIGHDHDGDYSPLGHNHDGTYLPSGTKLDDLAAPDDTTDLDVSTTKHGLCPKAPNDTAKFLRGDGTWNSPSGATDTWIGKTKSNSTGSVTVNTSDHGKWYYVSAAQTATYNLPAAATAGDGFTIIISNFASAGSATIDPSGSETIWFAGDLDTPPTTLSVPYGATYWVRCNGSGWEVLLFRSQDTWRTLVLQNDFTTNSASNQATNLVFTPGAGLLLLVEAHLLLRTATANIGARPGFSWPAGGTIDAGGFMMAPNSATAFAFRSWGPQNTQNAASTGLPDNTGSHYAYGRAFIYGAVSGTFGVTLAAETAGTNVTLKAGSILRYQRVIWDSLV